MPFSLPLPSKEPNVHGGDLENPGVVVIVGANGAGKSRYGAWLEFDSQIATTVRRVAAHRMLNFPASITLESVEQTASKFEYGAEYDTAPWNYRKANIYGNKPATNVLNDFQNLVHYLFAEHQDAASKYYQLAHSSGGTTQEEATLTKLLQVKAIWESVHNHREMLFGGAKVEVKPAGVGGGNYNASEMSDGERVSFYLIAQCLLAKQNGVIIVDEPELHLNRNIQSKLWNAIEANRDDCQFVYLTHDLDFAASRTTAKKLWFKSYIRTAQLGSNSEEGSSWDWVELPEDTGFPDDLLLSVVGSRKPILFVEGNKSSEDYLIYDNYYIAHTVIPRGGCGQVVTATNGFNGLDNLHTLHCQGIVDRDYRTSEQVDSLSSDNIHVIEVSEVENLLLTEEVLQVIEVSLLLSKEESEIEAIKAMVLGAFRTEKLRIIGSIAKNRLNTMMPDLKNIPNSAIELETAFNDLTHKIDVNQIYAEAEATVNKIIQDIDYKGALRTFDQKTLLGRLRPFYRNFSKTDFLEHFKRVLGSEHGDAMRVALSNYLPRVT